MNIGLNVPVLCAALAISGCAPFQWVRARTTQQMFQFDLSQCQYEASQGTPGYSGQTYRRASDQAVAILAESAAMAIRMDDLTKRCMIARGYSMQAIADTTAQAPPFVASAEESEAATEKPLYVVPLHAPAGTEPQAMTDEGREALVVLAASPAAEFTRKTSRYQYSAEQYAKGAYGCPYPVAIMSYFAPAVEAFVVSCGDDEPLSIRCAWGTCKILPY